MDYFPFLLLLGILVILYILEKIEKNKKPLFRAFITMIIGLSALALVNITTFLTGVKIPISLFTVGVSSGCGLPGVTLLLFLNLL